MNQLGRLPRLGTGRDERRTWAAAAGMLWAAAALVIALGTAACSPLRGLEAVRVVSDVASGDGPSDLKREVPEPSRSTVAYRGVARNRTGDLYIPGATARAGVVLVPGAAPQGKDDPRLVAFARTLARARFLVLVPEIESVRALKVSAGDSKDIADAVHHLAERTGSPSVGLVAISYAAGPAMLAAAEPELAGQVAFVVAVGGYYDIESTLRFFTTGWFRAGSGEWHHLRPNEYGKWAFLRSNADRLDEPADAALLAEIATRRMAGAADRDRDLVGGLGPAGRAVYALVTNEDRERVPELLENLPSTIRSEMRALDLSRVDLSTVRARVVLIHGSDDAIIPYTESAALARALGDRATLYLVDSLAHADLGLTGFVDALTLLRATYRVLEERDRAWCVPKR